MLSFFEMFHLVREAEQPSSVDFPGMMPATGIDKSHGTGGKFTRDKVVDPGAHLDRKLYAPDPGYARDRGQRQNVSYVGDHRGELSRMMAQNPMAALALKMDEHLPTLAGRTYESPQMLAAKLLSLMPTSGPINATNASEGHKALELLRKMAPHLLTREPDGKITVAVQGNPKDAEHKLSTGRYGHQKVNPRGGVGTALSASKESAELISIFQQMKSMKDQIGLMNSSPESENQILDIASRLQQLTNSQNPETKEKATMMLAKAEEYMAKLDKLSKYHR